MMTKFSGKLNFIDVQKFISFSPICYLESFGVLVIKRFSSKPRVAFVKIKFSSLQRKIFILQSKKTCFRCRNIFLNLEVIFYQNLCANFQFLGFGYISRIFLPFTKHLKYNVTKYLYQHLKMWFCTLYFLEIYFLNYL